MAILKFLKNNKKFSVIIGATCLFYLPSYAQQSSNENINQEAIADILDLTFINKDWITEQRPSHICPGYYKPLSIPQVTLPEVSADSSELAKNGVSILNGNVSYIDSQQKVSAKQAKIYRDTKLNKFTEIKVKGNVEYLTPYLRFVSSQLNTNLLNNTTTVNSPSYFHYYPRNARGQAQRAELIKDTSYNIYDAMFTTCPPDNTDWKIQASEIKIDPNRQLGTAKNTTLYFYNVPIFYTPYLSFPTSSQRESGFLMPLYSSSDRYGYSLATPYYLNLAPNYDATIAPRYMTERHEQILLETRYLNTYGLNIFNLEYMPNDPKFSKFRKDNLANPPTGISSNNPRLTNLKHANEQRYAIKIKDSRQWTPNLSSEVKYNYLSDNQYYIDLPRSGLTRQQAGDHLLQQARVNYSYHNWRSEILTKGYQTLHTIDGPDLTEPYRILPSISLKNDSINLYNSFNKNLPWSLQAAIDTHASRFASPSNPKPSKLAEGQRYYLKPEISLPIKTSYGYIKPRIAADIRYYDLNRLSPTAQSLAYNMNQDYFIPIFSLDTGIYLDKQFNINNSVFNHTLEPRLFYLNIPKKDQNKAPDFDVKLSTVTYEQLYRDNRFSGYDRQSSANQLTAGLVSRLQNYNTGQEYLKLQLGQGFYFEKKDTTICDQNIVTNCLNTEIPEYNSRYSPFISQLNFNFEPTLYGQAEWQWDYFLNTTRKINLGVHYVNQLVPGSSPQTILNLEYNFLKEGNVQYNVNGDRIFKVNNKRNDLSELESSIKLPILNNWTFLGFYSYDIRNQVNLDRYLGIELQKCCWAVRFGYRNQLRLRTNSLASRKYDNIFTVQFSLKGLGELNQGFESILSNNIRGYQNQLDQIY